VRFVGLVIVVCAFVCGGCSQDKGGGKSSGPATARVRVMTYNIHHAVGMDQKLKLERIAEVIKDAKPDFVALQEVDKGVSRSEKQDQAAELGRMTGMHAIFGKAVDWDGGDYGGAVLSRYPIVSSKVYKLPVTGGREPRVAVAVRVKPPGLPEMQFVGVHLEHQHEGDRLAQAKQLKAELDQIPSRNIILAGDFNAQPDTAAVEVFTKAGWENVSGGEKSFPAPYPLRKIDWVMVPQESAWKMVKSDVVAERMASDHRPVVVELEYGRRKK
jgi:endonuclease/exonuclease/phosphatase family metal-dependent hydrolase